MSTVVEEVAHITRLLDKIAAPEETWLTEQRGLVRDAACFLDEHKPGWHKKINTETLDLHSIFDCVLGQVFSPRFFKDHRVSGFSRGMDFLYERGMKSLNVFCLNNPHRSMWIEEVNARR